MSDTIVSVEQGKIKGLIANTENNVEFYMFKGIPYAKPPVGDLRFLSPQPPEKWDGVRDCSKSCNICPQLDKVTGKVIGDEDCLFLNVYTPKQSAIKPVVLPVMVFFHGGGFVFGEGTDNVNQGPEFLIEKDVVLVTINYRLGILGFLSLDMKEAPGNMGLKDQVQALKWVQKNITSFGGDPQNVTIFGISAGGASVEYLLLSPTAKGLFHKAIAQSGSSLLHWAQNVNVKELASKIPMQKGKQITDNQELLNYLKQMPVRDLIMSSMAAIYTNKFKGGLHFGFVPTVENPKDWEPFISKSTYQSLAKGEFTKVPLMTGICRHEGLIMISHGSTILDKFTKEQSFLDYFPFDISNDEKSEICNKLREIYPPNNKDDQFAIDFFSDADFLGGVHTAAKLIAKHNSPVYFYEFAYDGALNYIKKIHNINRKGACHGDETGYLVKCNKLKQELSDSDKYVKSLVLELWTNFAKNGDPNPSTNDWVKTKWEPMTKGPDMPCFVIDKNPSMRYEVYPARTKLYEELYRKKFG